MNSVTHSRIELEVRPDWPGLKVYDVFEVTMPAALPVKPSQERTVPQQFTIVMAKCYTIIERC